MVFGKQVLSIVTAAVTVLTLGAGVALAQDGKTSTTAGKSGGKHAGREGRKHGAGMRQKMMAQLGLTAEQQKQVETIRTETRSKMQAVRQDSKLNEEQKKTKLKEIAKASQARVQTVLTPEQREKIKQLTAQMRQQTKKRREAGGKQAGKGAVVPTR